jgi:muramoyltetrapeptide carboxypeptidase
MQHRRSFLAAAGAALAGAHLADAAADPVSLPLARARPLKPGDTVALITPATYVSNPDALLLAQRTVEFLGLKWKMGANVAKREGYLGGSVAERLADLHSAFADPGIAAVFCIRGGYGSAALLDGIDYALLRRNPKIFLGYSDITALHLGIYKRAGLVTFHGPMALAAFTDYTLDHFKRALFDAAPLGTLANPDEGRVLRPHHRTRTLRAGRATGALIGGNLTLVCSTLGTPYEIETAGKVLFLEDVGEEPYAIDRMLTQLRLAGKFAGIRGLVLGECADCTPHDYKPSFESSFSIGEVYDRILAGVNVPIFSGLAIGHTDDQLTLPLGPRVTIDADAGTLTYEEPALAAS